MPGPHSFLKLLDACNDIPLVFAVVMPSGFVCIQEFSDALTSISWNPALPAPKNTTEAAATDSGGPQEPAVVAQQRDSPPIIAHSENNCATGLTEGSVDAEDVTGDRAEELPPRTGDDQDILLRIV